MILSSYLLFVAFLTSISAEYCKTEMEMAPHHFVFVYGTLKSNFFNYNIYLRPAIDLKKAEFVYYGKTLVKYPLVLSGDTTEESPDYADGEVPCLLDHANLGYQVQGEIYLVDDDVLKSLDLLEDVDKNYYFRTQLDIQILSENKVISCFVYLQTPTEDLLRRPYLDNYDDLAHSRYKPKLKEAPSEYIPWATKG